MKHFVMLALEIKIYKILRKFIFKLYQIIQDSETFLSLVSEA